MFLQATSYKAVLSVKAADY